ncbi:MAG: hypothetical protein LBN30_00140 [Oscillospiraceae bacterium]|nr:hypothetical protein [Oscillospiraceae bacterium]
MDEQSRPVIPRNSAEEKIKQQCQSYAQQKMLRSPEVQALNAEMQKLLQANSLIMGAKPSAQPDAAIAASINELQAKIQTFWPAAAVEGEELARQEILEYRASRGGGGGCNSIEELLERIEELESRLEQVESTAQEAQETAENAQSAAEDAQSAAENAQSAAEEAQSAAEEAQSAAEDAKSAADDAQSTAEEAQSAAEEAQSAAENAQGAADDAQNTAEEAQSAAEEAKMAVDDLESRVITLF